MKLEHLLLGVLGMRPSTGYDLKKFFDTSGRYLRSNTQMSQVYRVLHRMADQGWVTYDVEPRQGAQDAKTYRVTPEGMTVFLDWLTGPYLPPFRARDPEFTARLSFCGFMTEEQLLRIVDAELAARRDQLIQLHDHERTIVSEAGYSFDVELAVAVTGRLAEWGSDDVERHIQRLERLREDILAGRLRNQA
ncbi:PadR family transcriptional regulator [Saccharopolyspora sp. NPDC000359]|uniref:PadR family transcriptional regulator n=1 Tax=Saccharopolyspora sp. NPDC000359 TaxID=3154251 RepID=UPI003324898B